MANVERLNREYGRALREADVVQKLHGLGVVPALASVAETQAQVNQEAPLWGPMLKQLGLLK